MVAVAAISLAFLSKAMLSRRQSYLTDAAYHARREAEELRNLANLDRNRRAGVASVKTTSYLKMEQASRLRAPYHAEMKQKYRAAAAHPWTSAPPDPSKPGEYLLWEAFMTEPMNEVDLTVEKLRRMSLPR